MRECRTYGSVRGVGGNAHPYRDSFEQPVVLAMSAGMAQPSGGASDPADVGITQKRLVLREE